MKARVKATGEIVNIEGSDSVFHYGKLLDGYIDIEGVKYLPNELEFDVKEKSLPKDEPDYWEKLKHQAAIAAMQTLLPQYEKMRHIETMEGFGNGIIKEGSDTDKIRKEHEILLADASIGYATALVNRLKEEEK